jgi:hypothetical protein
LTYQIADFTAQVSLVYVTNRWYANRLAESNAIATALNTDPTTHSREMEAPTPNLNMGNPANSPFTNDVLRVVNRGKAGNLTPLAMSNAITAALSTINPPANTSPPVVTSTSLSVAANGVCSTTVGNWTYVPTAYFYQWYRGAVPIPGATANSYTLVVADEGSMISCRVTAENAAGSAIMASNSVGPVTA